jgi:hypothetical protein
LVKNGLSQSLKWTFDSGSVFTMNCEPGRFHGKTFRAFVDAGTWHGKVASQIAVYEIFKLHDW